MMQVPLLQCRWELVGGFIDGLRLVLMDGCFKLRLNNYNSRLACLDIFQSFGRF